MRDDTVSESHGFAFVQQMRAERDDTIPRFERSNDRGRFAAECGMPLEDLLTTPAAESWRAGIEGRLPEEFRDAQGTIVSELLGRATHLATDPERDAWTLPIVPKVLALGMPLFAICRGFQEANVALGGTLFQAVHTVEGFKDHRDRGDPQGDEQAPHEIHWQP